MSRVKVGIEIFYNPGNDRWGWEVYTGRTLSPRSSGQSRYRWRARQKALNALMNWVYGHDREKRLAKKALSYEAEIELED